MTRPDWKELEALRQAGNWGRTWSHLAAAHDFIDSLIRDGYWADENETPGKRKNP